MSNLRSKMIRLAHEQPELRPYLLPLLKEGGRTAYWTPLPDDETDFGYKGPTAHREGLRVAAIIKAAFNETRANASDLWKKVALALLEAADVDVQPGLSREIAAASFERNYKDLAEKVEEYFPKVPVP